jgi:peptidoglycan/LPS O-acetylase OafA/YrhL
MAQNMGSSAPSNPAEDKLLGIEILRFASALAVLVFHYQHFGFVGLERPNFVVSAQPFYRYLRLFYEYGHHGVQVFWCISGFIFFWKYGRSIPAGSLGGYKFFVLRFSRLYPLHLVTLLYVAALQAAYFHVNGAYFVYAYNDAYHFLLQLFMASNWGFQAGDSFNGPIWSISIEVLVYILFYLSLRFISGSVFMIAALTALPAAITFFKWSTHPVFSCMMYFYLGCLTAIGYSWARAAQGRIRAATVAALVAMVGIIALQYFVTVKPVYFLLVFSPALIFLSVAHLRGSARTSGLLVAAGSVTYSSYLLHVPIQLTTMTIASSMHCTIPINSGAFFIAFLSVTLALAYLCYRHFEVPAQEFLRRRLR